MSDQFHGKLFLKSSPTLGSNDTSALGKLLGFIDQKRFVDPFLGLHLQSGCE